MNKRTHEEIERKISAKGHRLLSQYESADKKLSILCPNGHEYKMNWDHFNGGRRCGFCLAEEKKAKRLLLLQTKAKKIFEDEGYQLLDKCIHRKRRLRFICPQGHKYSMSFDSRESGVSCAICSGAVVTRKDVRDSFSAIGYTLLSNYNYNNKEKLDFICDQGHQHKIAWTDFKSGKRCIFCSNRAPLDPDFVEQSFRADGYIPLAQYQSPEDKIPYICPNGHYHSIRWNNFRSGNRCPECHGRIVRHEDVALAFSVEGYELLDTYKDSTSPLKYICPEGHRHSIVWTAFQQGVRCAYCAGRNPSEERKEIIAIQHKVRNLIRIYIKQQEAQKTFPFSGFSGRIAKVIYEALGSSPDGCHLDHIIPQSFFDFRDQDEIEACWHIDNLRYIPASENTSRGNRLTIEEVKSFSESQLKLLTKASRKPRVFNRFLSEAGYRDHPDLPQQAQTITLTQLTLDI